MQLDPIEAELLDLLDGFNGIFRIRENSAEAEELWMLLLDLFGKAVDGAFLAGPGRDMQHHAVIGTPFVKFLQSPRDRAVGVVCALCDGGEFLAVSYTHLDVYKRQG